MKSVTRTRWLLTSLFTVVVGITTSDHASAQLVIDRSWFEMQVDTTIELENYRADVNDAAEAVYNDEFVNGTFDLSSLTFRRVYQEVNESMPMPADVPGADMNPFSSADYVTVFNYGDG